MKRCTENVLVLIKVKLMERWADSIFYFEKCVTQSIKVPFENKAADPTSPELWSLCLSLFFFFLSLSPFFFRQTPWSTKALWVHFFAWVSKTRSGRRSVSSPNQEGTLRLHPTESAPEVSVNRASPVSGALLAFCVNQGIYMDIFYFLSNHHVNSTMN